VTVAGVRVGHFTDLEGATGCTVVLAPPEGAIAGVDVRGTAAATLATEALRPGGLVERAHAVLLTGGSAFGLAAGVGVLQWLEERGIGFEIGPVRVPIVVGAVLFDLLCGSSTARPDPDAGYAACEAAADGPVGEGSIGAGTGATVGKQFGTEWSTKGGLGTASTRIGRATVGAIAAANSVGDVIDPTTGGVVATNRKQAGEASPAPPGTTLAVVATDAELTREQATVVASMAHDGIARATRPSHALQDGDTVFVLATGGAGTADLTAIGHAAAVTTSQAIVRAVRGATGLAGIPAVSDLAGDE
jgi:L-aminopeptidase/D-esterase-like protein